MRILINKDRNFYKKLNDLLLKRKTKVRINTVSVSKIINDVKKRW